MKDYRLTQLAQELGVSKSTVSKVLNHCGGVDTELRRRILRSAKAFAEDSTADTCTVYGILPDTPSFFWREMRRGLADGVKNEPHTCKCNIYSELHDEETVLSYLAEAERMNVQVIIIAASVTPAIHEKLTALRPGRLILLLSEYYALANAFYVGSDAYRDGQEMGRLFAASLRGGKPLLVSHTENYNVRERIRGFRDVLAAEAPSLYENITMLELDVEIFSARKLMPSHFAAQLSRRVSSVREDVVGLYFPMGFLQLPLAVKKVKTEKTIYCFGLDCLSEGERDSGVYIDCGQDVYLQGLTAMQAAVRFATCGEYPPQKRILVPSRFYLPHGGEMGRQ